MQEIWNKNCDLRKLITALIVANSDACRESRRRYILLLLQDVPCYNKTSNNVVMHYSSDEINLYSHPVP